MARVVHTQQTVDRASVQPMPQLSDEQLAALRDDIAENGVLVPITVDQNGRIIDGNNRAAIAAELFVECPEVVVEVADDEAAHELALSLNCARRHLNQEQRRELIRAELDRRPGDTDRAIARRLGCSPTTVGTVRKAVSNLDTPSATREEAEKATEDMQRWLMDARGALYALVGQALTHHATVTEVVGALTMARLRYQQRPLPVGEVKAFFVEEVYDYVTTVAMWPETVEQYPANPDLDPACEERAWFINAITMMGDEKHPADEVAAS